MRWIYKLPLRLRSVFRKQRVESELNDELRFHLEKQIEENIAGGMPPEEARYAARREFGGIEQMKEECRDSWGVRMISEVGQDLHYGLRQLRRNPGFTIIAVLTLAIGIGASTTVFSVVNAVLLRPLPYVNPGRLVAVLQGKGSGPVAPANFKDWQAQNRVFQEMGAAEWWEPNLQENDKSERVMGLHLTPEVLHLLGVQPLLGRVFTPEEGERGREHVVVLSYGLWQRGFGGDQAVLGAVVRLNGEPYTVVGVMPEGFKFAPFWAARAEIWAPLVLGDKSADRMAQSLRIFARLKDGVTLQQARSEMEGITSRLEKQFPGTNRDVAVVPLQEKVVGDVRPALLVLLGSVAFVLLIGCANVAHMLLARSAAREREMALRAAIGASSRRLVRQLLTESVVLALLGCLGGLVLAAWGIRLVIAASPPDLPGVEAISMDWRVLMFTLGVSVLTGVLFGLAPAIQASSLDLNQSLKESGRGATTGMRRRSFRSLLVMSEFAMAAVLLAGAGLMIQSFIKVERIDPGFDSQHLLSAIISVAGTREEGPGRRSLFFQEAVERVAALPGVKSVSAINHLPLDGDEWDFHFAAGGRPLPRPVEAPHAIYRSIMPGYFRTMGIPLLRGRDITRNDNIGSPPVVIINEKLARQYWPGGDAVGQRLALYDNDQPVWYSIVGVAANSKQQDWTGLPQPEMYFPYLQTKMYLESSSGWAKYITLVVRTGTDPAQLAPAVRNAIWELEKGVAVSKMESMDDVIAGSLSRPHLYVLLLSAFGGIALLLAAIGIYGVMSRYVASRTHEIGVYLALGAEPRAVLRLITRHGMTLAGIGIATGVIAGLGLTRFMARILYEVQPSDPLTFLMTSLVLIAVAFAACYIPARRAAKVHPMVALRYE
jgi:putative ABC transport system permease protein